MLGVFYHGRSSNQGVPAKTARFAAAHSGARRFEKAAAREQAAEAEQDQPGLLQAHAPENFPGLIARIFSERTNGRRVQEIHEAAVIGLLEIVKSTAQQEMQIELAAESLQLAAEAAV